jgi:tetratricopeptide (TPR) repeat protein
MTAFSGDRWRTAASYLDLVLDAAPDDQSRYLELLRTFDAQISADVDVLLAHHRAVVATRFLEDSPALPPTGPAAGTRVGDYMLRSLIGQGGMGSVWLADRIDGRFEGRAAVKLLNTSKTVPGGQSRYVREGTILARLTHPSIARLLDAGLVPPDGPPYLVLEYVDGKDITTYCDLNRLEVHDRVRLFIDVLDAVAHAHANLVVHRDIKPSNVLVTPEGRVKLLDFGVAKLLENTRGRADVTAPRERSGLTPRYAAPEQIDDEPVTTATDVYALGVLLYELVARRHPAGTSDMPAGELLKAIIVNDPPPPSAAGPVDWRRDISGDLDTIVMKALKKRPGERYQSGEAMADDLRRYLHHEPIGARPDSLRYRAAKFARRHRGKLTAAAFVFLAATGLVGFYTARLSAERDRSQREAAKATRISELLTGLLTAADPYRTPDAKEVTVRNMLDLGAERIDRELADQPELRAEMLTVIGRVYQRLGAYDKAQPLLERALPLGRESLGGAHPRVAQTLNDLGVLHRERGDSAGAKPLLEEALVMRRTLLGPKDPAVAVTLVELARVNKDLGFPDESARLVREALDVRRAALGEEHQDTATSMNDLALLLVDRGELDEAERLFRRTLEIYRHLLGPTHESAVIAQGNLGLALYSQGRSAEAEAVLRDALRIEEKNFGADSPQIAPTLNNLAYAVLDLGRRDEAQAILERAVSLTRAGLGDAHPRYATCALNLGRVYLLNNDARAAEPLIRRALEIRTKLMRPGDWRIAQAQSLLGGALLARGRAADAERLLRDAKIGLRPVPGIQGRERDANDARLAALAKLNRVP